MKILAHSFYLTLFAATTVMGQWGDFVYRFWHRSPEEALSGLFFLFSFAWFLILSIVWTYVLVNPADWLSTWQARRRARLETNHEIQSEGEPQ